ncbi:DNA polymerase III subunit delta [Candidatus Peregrinibacteria bacterium]|nr:DNA polymerase III subunit delta [Candidatus Peregrinibacteria bacterium]
MKNLFLFTGEETYLLYEQARHWKQSFIEKCGEINLTTLDATQTSAHAMIAQMGAFPFLGDKRLLFIEQLPEASKGADKDKESDEDDEKPKEDPWKALADFLPTLSETSVAVFIQPKPDKRKSFYKTLAKLAEIKTFNPLKESALNHWILQRAKEKNAALSPDLFPYLVSLTGSDLWRLSQEIDKLATFAEGQPITREAIDLLVAPSLEANIFHLTDALGAKNHKEAIRQLHLSVSAGNNLRQTFYMIVRQFRLFLQIKNYCQAHPKASGAEVAAALHLHPFVVRNTQAQTKHFDNPSLFAAYGKLLDIDHDLKTSRIKVTTENQDELALAIERFILDFCRRV